MNPAYAPLLEPKWLAKWRGATAMQVPEEFRKAVVFIGTKEGDKFIPKATGFWISESIEQYIIPYVVTAEHVIARLKTRGFEKIWIRVNKKEGGTTDLVADVNQWYFHPDESNRSDVAVAPFILNDASLDTRYIAVQSFLTQKKIAALDIGLGDEVCIVGLFRSHYGLERNRPIVRIGNIALMGEEPVFTKYAGFMDAFLVEARSIAGLSGSPVWFHHAPTKVVDGQFKYYKGIGLGFLGLVHGHFDVQNLNEDMVLDDAGSDDARGVNTGIGVVIPAEKIIETINHPDLMAWKSKMLLHTKRVNAQRGATPDLADDGPESPPASENPQHREDFNRLLSAAARKQKQDD